MNEKSAQLTANMSKYEMEIQSKNQSLRSQAIRLETYAKSVERLTIDLDGKLNELDSLKQKIERIETEK